MDYFRHPESFEKSYLGQFDPTKKKLKVEKQAQDFMGAEILPG